MIVLTFSVTDDSILTKPNNVSLDENEEKMEE
jgi:hypothetical protein